MCDIKTLEMKYNGQVITLRRVGDELYIPSADIRAAAGIEFNEEKLEELDINHLTLGRDIYVTEAGAVSICLELGKEDAGEFVGWLVCEAMPEFEHALLGKEYDTSEDSVRNRFEDAVEEWLERKKSYIKAIDTVETFIEENKDEESD